MTKPPPEYTPASTRAATAASERAPSKQEAADAPAHGGGNKMWGGRFARPPSDLLDAINVSVDYDQRLYEQDIAGSIAHANMLAQCGIITREDAQKIEAGLHAIGKEIGNGSFEFRRELEDIHMNIEAALSQRVGDAGARLHTARSRNDQVATDLRLYCRHALQQLEDHLRSLIQTIIDRAEEYSDAVMPGFTHLQMAQPVTFGHHLMAWCEALLRDLQRLQDARHRLNESPLGAAALAGTAFPIDRHLTAKSLGFRAPMQNSLDAVSARDFVIETISVCSILSIQLSRMAEELIIFSSTPFDFIHLSDAFTTGSSIMPQKRNPDAAELIRARAGRVCGHLMAQLTTMKGLSLAYAKDMQEDKEAVFDALDVITLSVKVMQGIVADMKANTKRMSETAQDGYSTATDLADWLVRELDMPFRQAHGVTASVVQAAAEHGAKLHQLSLEQMQTIEPRINASVFDVLNPKHSVRSRNSLGGTAPQQVRKQIARRRNFLNK